MQGLVDIASDERERRREVESRLGMHARQLRYLQIANKDLQNEYAQVFCEKENLEERLDEVIAGRSNISDEVLRSEQPI